jgi:hypothetical protein
LITEKLVREKEVTSFSFDEALELYNTDFLVSEKGEDIKDTDLNADGALVWGSDSYLMTDWAFESICYILNIPLTYARSIPPELLIHTFDKLKEIHNQRAIFLISRGIVINVVPHPYVPLKNRELLIRFQNEIVPQTGLKLNEIGLSDRGMVVTFLREGLQLEPAPGDVSRLGLTVLNSETGWRGAKASFYLLRLLCGNGTVTSNAWGSAEWSYDYRLSLERSMQNFNGQLIKLEMDVPKFESIFNQLLSRELLAFEFVRIIRRLIRITGFEDADEIVGLSATERNRLYKEDRWGDRMLSTGLIMYDIYNKITAAAKEYPFVQRRNMEALGGSIIDMVIPDG